MSLNATIMSLKDRKRLISALADGQPLAFRRGDNPINSNFIYIEPTPTMLTHDHLNEYELVQMEADNLHKLCGCVDGVEQVTDRDGESNPQWVIVFDKQKLEEFLGISQTRARSLASNFQLNL